MKVYAIVLSWKRPDNIPIVVEGLKKQKLIEKIIIFHNHPSNIRIEGCDNIVSDINFRCLIRHKIAELLDYDYFIFSDDDLYLTKDISDELEYYMKTFGKHSVLGVYGRNLDFESEGEAYTKGTNVVGDSYKKVDIVKGRFHIISKQGIDILSKTYYNGKYLKMEDDIRASTAIHANYKKRNILIPIKKYLKDLPEPHALWLQPEHMSNRDKAIEEAIELDYYPDEY